MKKILFLLFFTFIVSCGRKTSLRGKIYITGNEPFVNLAIMTSSGKSHLISKRSKAYFQLWNLQQKYVLVYYEKAAGDSILIRNFKLIGGK